MRCIKFCPSMLHILCKWLFLVSKNCEHSTVYRFFCFRAPWTSQHSLQIWSHILQLSCNLPMLALHCTAAKITRWQSSCAMNWCCIMPCSVRCASCRMLQIPSNFAADTTQLRDSNSKRPTYGTPITGAFTQRCFHKDMFSHRHLHMHTCFYPGMVLHASTFLRRCFYTGMLLYQKNFYTQTRVLHFYTQMPLHSDAFTEECFYTHVLLHRVSFDTS